MTNPLAITFNGPLEAGIRTVFILGSAYPVGFDMQRLVAYDYLIVRTSIVGGPPDLHPPAPIQSPATEVRRKTVQAAVNLMMTRDLVEQSADETGIVYRAGETAAVFIQSLTTPYIRDLKERADWLTAHFSEEKDEDFDAMMRSLFDSWVVEFQEVSTRIEGK